MLLQGQSRLHGDVSGQMGQMWAIQAYVIDAEISIQLRNYSRALGAIKAGRSLESDTSPKTFLIEGELWQKLSDTKRAELAYVEASLRGSKEAEAPLKAMYEKKHGGLAGFEAYLEKARLAAGSSTADRKLAPPFTASSLDGKQLDLAAMRGKVVVLNFWFIGCAPCRVEIPGLNELASEFAGKDVVFVGLATDPADDLKRFLKTSPFKYQIVADSLKIASQYDVSGYPVHIVIDRQGKIISRLTGGSKERHNDLRPLIARALSDQ